MKSSNTIELGDVPSHWHVCRLKSFCRLAYGDSLCNDARRPGNVSVYGSNGVVGQHYSANTNSPCIVVGRKGSFGKVNYSAEPVFAIDTTFYVDRRQTSADIRWLYYLLGWLRLDAVTKDSAIPGLDREDAYQRLAPLPPPAEQTAIARFLDHMDCRIQKYIRAKEKLTSLLDEYKQTLVHQVVTGRIDVRTSKPYPAYEPSGVEWLGKVPAHWNVLALRHRYSQCLGKMLDTSKIKGDHLVPYLRNIDVQWDQINVHDLPAMDIAPDEYERYTVRKGDLVVCEGGEVGRCAIWESKLEVCGFQKALHRLRPLDARRDLVRFLYHALRVAVQREAFNDGHQSTIAHLTGEKLRVHRFPFPPTSEQKAIVSFLDAAVAPNDRSLDDIRRQTNLLREYRTRLIADVVTGKLDVREVAAKLPEIDHLASDDQTDELLDASKTPAFDQENHPAEAAG